MTVQAVQQRLRDLGNPEDARFLQRFFKTGPGEYGEGDVFLGIRVPVLRRVVKEFRGLPLADVTRLLESPVHEDRLVALLLLANGYNKAEPTKQEQIYDLYLTHTRYINNWDLVDSSAEHVVGAYLQHRSREPLYALARSPLLWDRRIAVLATFHYIKQDEFGETLRVAESLIDDREDLIHKAVGWMLREVGKRDQEVEEIFLRQHYRTMPRTMLRYAIERFPEDLRLRYLKGEPLDVTAL